MVSTISHLILVSVWCPSLCMYNQSCIASHIHVYVYIHVCMYVHDVVLCCVVLFQFDLFVYLFLYTCII